MPADARVLALVARYPSPGQGKTRLARDIGAWPTYALYSAILRDLQFRLAQGPWQLHWLYTPTHAPFSEWIGASQASSAQTGAGLNERLLNGFRTLLRTSPQVIIMSTDSPHVPLHWLDQGFQMLDDHDVVLGPCDDGGYYLVGMREPHDIFSGIVMSTPTVLRETIDAAERRRLRVGLLPPTFDLDDAATLTLLDRWLAEHPTELRQTRSLLPRRYVGLPDLSFHEVGAFFTHTPSDTLAEARRVAAVIEQAHPAKPTNTRTRHLTGALAQAITESLRHDLGIPLSDLAVLAAQQQQAVSPSLAGWRSARSRSARSHLERRTNGVHLAWLARQANAPRLAHIFLRCQESHGSRPEPLVIDAFVLRLAKAIASDLGNLAAEHRGPHAATYQDQAPTADNELNRTLATYRSWGLDLKRIEAAALAAASSS